MQFFFFLLLYFYILGLFLYLLFYSLSKLSNSFISCPTEIWYLKFSSEVLCLFWDGIKLLFGLMLKF